MSIANRKSSLRTSNESQTNESARKKPTHKIHFYEEPKTVKSDSRSSDTRSSASTTKEFLDDNTEMELVAKYAELMAENEQLRTENKLFQDYIENTADPQIISQVEQQKEDVKRDMRRRRIFAPIKRVVSEKLGLKKAVGTQSMNLLEAILEAKRTKEAIRVYEASHLDTWQKIDICLAALSDTRNEMRKNEQFYSKKFVDAISQLDLLKMTEHDLLDAQDEFNRVCFKALNPTTGTYEADRIAKYWENQIGKKSSCLARQLLLGNQLTNEIRLKMMKEKLRAKRICAIAEQSKVPEDGKGSVSDDSGRLSDNKFMTGGGAVDKVQQWMVDKEMMELEKQKDMLAKLQKQCSRVGLQLADVTNNYQNTKSELQEGHSVTKELTQEINDATLALESLDEQIYDQERILQEVEQKNLRLIEKYMGPRKTRSIHSQIMMNAEVYELKKQIRIWERKVQIREHEESNLIATVKAEAQFMKF